MLLKLLKLFKHSLKSAALTLSLAVLLLTVSTLLTIMGLIIAGTSNWHPFCPTIYTVAGGVIFAIVVFLSDWMTVRQYDDPLIVEKKQRIRDTIVTPFKERTPYGHVVYMTKLASVGTLAIAVYVVLASNITAALNVP